MKSGLKWKSRRLKKIESFIFSRGKKKKISIKFFSMSKKWFKHVLEGFQSKKSTKIKGFCQKDQNGTLWEWVSGDFC